MAAIKRRRLDSGAWRALLARQHDSGVPIGAFCRRESVSTASFYRWRNLLGAGTAIAASDRAPDPDRRSPFVDLGGLGSHPTATRPLRLHVQIGGFRLQLERG